MLDFFIAETKLLPQTGTYHISKRSTFNALSEYLKSLDVLIIVGALFVIVCKGVAEVVIGQ